MLIHNCHLKHTVHPPPKPSKLLVSAAEEAFFNHATQDPTCQEAPDSLTEPFNMSPGQTRQPSSRGGGAVIFQCPEDLQRFQKAQEEEEKLQAAEAGSVRGGGVFWGPRLGGGSAWIWLCSERVARVWW